MLLLKYSNNITPDDKSPSPFSIYILYITYVPISK